MGPWSITAFARRRARGGGARRYCFEASAAFSGCLGHRNLHVEHAAEFDCSDQDQKKQRQEHRHFDSDRATFFSFRFQNRLPGLVWVNMSVKNRSFNEAGRFRAPDM